MSIRRLVCLLCILVGIGSGQSSEYSEMPEVQMFLEYLQINTTTYADLTPAVEFWQAAADEIGLESTVHYFYDDFPVVVLKWTGSDPSLSSIMLNSHMDVVPADESDGWDYPPFSGTIDDDDVIWGRGTQDMKSVSIQYYQAIKHLISNNVTNLRTVYMTLMPDEEVGGEYGMQAFLNSTAFADMNVGFGMDEGGAFNIAMIPVLYQDKALWQFQVDCYGTAAHGSTYPALEATAVGKCYKVMQSAFAYREEQYQAYLNSSITNAGVYTSVNLNKLYGGTANNIIPDHVWIFFDTRLNTTMSLDEYEAKINSWIADAGDNVTLTYILKESQSPATLVSSSNPYWVTIDTELQALGVTPMPIIPPGATDSRFVRSAGIPAFGFSPMPNTELLVHAVNERLAASTFVTGISIYEALIPSLAALSADAVSTDPSSYIVATA